MKMYIWLIDWGIELAVASDESQARELILRNDNLVGKDRRHVEYDVADDVRDLPTAMSYVE